MHKVLQMQCRESLQSLKEAHADALRQLRQLQADGMAGIRSPGAEDSDMELAREPEPEPDFESVADKWQDEMISTAQERLQAAMASEDPEALRQAILNASSSVAKARVRNQQVRCGGRPLHTPTRARKHAHAQAHAHACTHRQQTHMHTHTHTHKHPRACTRARARG